MGAWGTGAWGTGAWGAAADSISIDLAYPVATNCIRVVLSAEPAHASGLAAGDVLNPQTWTIQRLDNDQYFTILGVEVVDLPRSFNVYTLERLADHLTQHRIRTTVLRSVAGILVTPPYHFDFLGLERSSKTSFESANRRYPVKDIANPPAQPGMSGLAGVFKITADGDYASEEGIPLLRKLILRRITTRRGGFFHLPDYGLGIDVKDILPRGGDLLALKQELEQQVRLEPDVRDVEAGVQSDAEGTIVIKLYVESTFGSFAAGVMRRNDGSLLEL